MYCHSATCLSEQKQIISLANCQITSSILSLNLTQVFVIKIISIYHQDNFVLDSEPGEVMRGSDSRQLQKCKTLLIN